VKKELIQKEIDTRSKTIEINSFGVKYFIPTNCRCRCRGLTWPKPLLFVKNL
jgi:hypothetical protein